MKDYMRNRNKDPKLKKFNCLSLKELGRKRRIEIFALLGCKCNKCGFSDIRALQIDHVNGNGVEDRRKFGKGTAYYLHVLKEIKAGSKNYQILCANCNQIKKVENKEFMQCKYE